MQAIKVFSIVAVLMLSLLLAWGAIGANGPSWQPLAPEALDAVRGGQSCYWNNSTNCPPADFQNLCYGCNPNHTCNYQNASYPQIMSYSNCINTYMGLTDCGFPNTVYCWYDMSCSVACTYSPYGWQCTIANQWNATPETETSASGNNCGMPMGRNDIRRDDRCLALIASANGFGFDAFNR